MRVANVASWPWADVLGFPALFRRSGRAHRSSRAPIQDFCLQASWKRGPAARAPGPVLVSFTQFRIDNLGDLVDIWLAAERLGRELVEIPEARGVATYLQPGRRRVGSVSTWTRESGLHRFVSLPSHLEVVRRYRQRGGPLRSEMWWAERVELGWALAEGQRRAEAAASNGKRAGASGPLPDPDPAGCDALGDRAEGEGLI